MTHSPILAKSSMKSSSLKQLGTKNGDYYAKFVGYDELHRCIFCSMYTERTGEERMAYLREMMRFAWRTPVDWSYSIIRYLRIALDISSH